MQSSLNSTFVSHAQDKLWDSFIDRIFATPIGLDLLTADERLYYVVRVLNDEVRNGGFGQYFYNCSGEHFQEALAGLKLLGANKAATLLRKAARVAFADGKPPADRTERWNSTRDLTTKARARIIEQLEDAYYEDSDKLGERLTWFAEQKGLLAPFMSGVEA